MISPETQGDTPSQVPSRTSILVAAIRAFGSREPDEYVRNPDSMADLLMGPSELALIAEHPISIGLRQSYGEASQNPAIVLFASLMLRRTRFIDEALERAVNNGATQIVILGAGFDTRAYRFRELLSACRVIEVDAAYTQAYKKHRLKAVLRDLPNNVTFCTVDFSKDDLMDRLRHVGFQQYEKTLYIWEGVCMYISESSVRKTLRAIASESVPGSTVVLDYANEIGIELGKFTPNGAGGIPAPWGEPWIFGVPGSKGTEFFRDLGFDPGAPISVNDPEITRRYATRLDGTSYAAPVLEKLRTQPPTLSQTAPERFLETQRAAVSAGGTYWFTELKVLNRPTPR